MSKFVVRFVLVAAVAALAFAGAMTTSFAAKKKAAAAKPACAAGQLCAGACNETKWCNIQVCSGDGKNTPTLGYCWGGSPFCPPKC